ncbi:hypothetical protein B0H13DRAFT_2349102 [Mycena leptocephala]|nr:hypothetical protein B0H13DRAFT_2349102 [Mycena leptocephala]
MSPMADLQREYLRETEEESSIFSRVTLISSKIALDPRDVIDRGIDPVNPVPRFGLDPGFALRVRVTVTDMQSILKRAASMIPGRDSCFIIDPGDALMPILRGASGLEELNAAWIALQRRMQLAQGFLTKYDQHYRTLDENLRSTSPVSTNVDVYERWPISKAQSVQLTYLFDNVRHHQDQVPKDYNRDTDDILSYLKPPARLSSAFPERNPEPRPSTVYYSATGERKERLKPEFSSWGAGKDFEPPTAHFSSEGRNSPEVKDTYEEEARSEREYDQEERAPTMDVPSAGYYYPNMSAHTPFKKPEEFFVPKSPSAFNRDFRVPGPNLPNPIRGMASAAPYGLSSDSVSQAMKARRDATRQEHRRSTGEGGPMASTGLEMLLLICPKIQEEWEEIANQRPSTTIQKTTFLPKGEKGYRLILEAPGTVTITGNVLLPIDLDPMIVEAGEVIVESEDKAVEMVVLETVETEVQAVQIIAGREDPILMEAPGTAAMAEVEAAVTAMEAKATRT